jgi:hypothetical protein
MALFNAEPFATAHTTGSSRSARTSATCCALSARSSPSTAAVLPAATFVMAETSSRMLVMSSSSASRPVATKRRRDGRAAAQEQQSGVRSTALWPVAEGASRARNEKIGAGLGPQAEHFSLATTDPNLDPALFAGHSLRSGFLTSAAEAGASVFKMMEVSRAQVGGYAASLRAMRRSVPQTSGERSCDLPNARGAY